MPYTMTINGCRLTSRPGDDWSNATNSGDITATYVAGYFDGATFHDDNSRTKVGSATVSLSATEVASTAIVALCQEILTQEGLTSGQDHIYNPDSSLLY